MAARSERYRLGKLLGRGGVAEVYEAIGVDAAGVEQRLALKRLIEADESQLDAFADEAKIASRLRHPNLVQVLDYGVLDDRPFLALELIEGLDLTMLSLRARDKGERLSVELAIFITLEIAHALDHAHQAKGADGRPLGIVHRDVSPENILVSGSGEVKLSDFGIALATDRLSRTSVGTVKGKKSYMAPEQALGETVDARADLFALGCVLSYLVVGKSPLEDPAAQDAVLRGGNVPIPPNLPPPLAAVLEKTLARSPARRFSTANELGEALGKVLYARISRDPRSLLKAFMSKMMEGQGSPRPTPLEELMDVARILGGTREALPRFASRIERKDGTLQLRDKAMWTQQIRERHKPGEPSGEGSGSDPAPTPPTGDDRLLGTVIRGYRLTGVIGRGALA